MSNETATKNSSEKELTKEEARKTILEDYRLANISREASLLGRREVLTGKAKFGIFGDGKEIPQIAMSKVFRDGDFRSGYYRDQTFMMAIGQLTVQEFFAQLYAHTDVEAEPASAGRQMNGHFATRSLDDNGEWKDLTKIKNSSADISPTGGQMARLLGLAQASKVYRENEKLKDKKKFSNNGNEVAFGTIGDSSTSEGIFWETINAAGVLQVPMVLSVWDDGHGISVPIEYQTTKQSISEVLSGFQRTEDKDGFEIIKVKGWSYVDLIKAYEKAEEIARNEHVPVIIHVQEVTQPQGHSTSGSHERYKSKERLEWETEYCCINQMRKWILEKKIASEEELESIEKEAKKQVRKEKGDAWKAFLSPINQELKQVQGMIDTLISESSDPTELKQVKQELDSAMDPFRREVMNGARKALRVVHNQDLPSKKMLSDWLKKAFEDNHERYSAHLYSETDNTPLKIEETFPEFEDDNEEVDGRIILRDNFDVLLEKHPEVLIFGEDSGKIGDVNQGLEGMQDKYGETRVSDTGIREASILGQGIGMAMRGLRPIPEIQYLDYLLYCFQVMSDDLSTVRYRTYGGQMAPVIVRTRGHRLEGIWHSGSPMGTIINGIRGMHVCVPRNLTQAAGFYNTLLRGDDPALIIEPLNAYRSKEKLPSNLGEFTTPLGVPEIVTEGSDITLVSYGPTCNLCETAVKELEELGISAELIDVRTLLPFDINGMIADSLKKTNRILIIDEDVPGGASAFMLDQIVVKQKGYYHLDSEPKTLAAKDHRPAYASDGDYFSKPSIDDIVESAYKIMHEADPEKYPELY